ncbi:collagen alpha-6(VI) chain-like [Rhinoraja longicauda]
MAHLEAALIVLLFAMNLPSTDSQMTACTEVSTADIVFLVDGSWSIGTQNFERIQEFLYTLVNGFDVGEDKVRIGLIQYSENPQAEFFLNTFHDKNEILQKIQQLPYKGGGTRTGLGLKFMLNMLFVASAGSRALMGVPQVAIVITDGQSQDNVDLPAKALKEQGISVYAIGIRDAKEEELKEIASQPSSDYVYNVADFTALREISQAVIQVVCTRVEEVSREVSKVAKSSIDCRDAKVADIVLLVDGSSSINNENFKKVKDFLHTFVNGLQIARNGMRIGLVQYSGDPRTEFFLNQYSSKNSILNYLENMSQKKGSTNLTNALEFLQSQHFVPAAGSRADEGVKQIAIVITDGGSVSKAAEVAAQLRSKSVTIYVVGVEVKSPGRLYDISSRPPEKYTHKVESFNMLSEFSKTLLESVCGTVVDHIQAFAMQYADVVFLVDGSQHVGLPGFNQIRNFILKTVSQLEIGVDKYQVGLAQYGISTHSDFLLNDFQTIAKVTNYIRNIRRPAFRGSRGLRTGSAIDFLSKTFFNASTGSRQAQGFPQIAVIITSESSRDNVIPAAREIRSKGVKVISIGVKNSSLDELKDIAFPSNQFYFQVDAGDALVQLSKKIPSTIKMIVQEQFQYRESSRQTACQSDSVADIIFLVEGSDNFGAINFQLLRIFLQNVIFGLDVKADKVRIGLVQYNKEPTAEFYLRTYHQKSEILEHVRLLPYRGGGRMTGNAINFVWRNCFTLQSGSRAKKGIPQIMILITSGESQDQVAEQADSLRRKGVVVYALGIGNANVTELENIASYPSKTYVSRMKDFIQLLSMMEIAQKKICSEVERQISVAARQEDDLKQGCIQTEEADIFFLIDGSFSIQSWQFEDVRRFLIDVVNVFNIGADQVRVGVVQYATTSRIEFGVTQYTNKTSLETAIKQISQMKGKTGTGLALGRMKDHFSEAAKSRGTTVPRFLITITDGKSDDKVEIPARELMQQGIIMYAIGVGRAIESELQLICGTKERVYYANNFDALKFVKNHMVQQICSPKACSKLGDADIIFLIDGSDSIRKDDFTKIKTFMVNIVDRMTTGSDHVRIGLIQFSTQTKLEFELNEYSSNELQKLIHTMKQLASGTNTGKALNFTADYFAKLTVSQAGSSRYLIVVTDGESRDEVLIPAKNVRDKQVTVLAVGIRDANTTQLLEIGGANDKVFYIEEFDLLKDLEEQISWQICLDPDDKFACLKTDAMDIVFVIDGSSNTQPDAFKHMKSFMRTMVNISIVTSDHVQFAAILLNEKADVQFQLNQFRNKREIHKAIFQMQRLGGTATIAHALNQAKQVLATDKGGQKAQGASQFIIVMSNEEATESVQQLVADFTNNDITVITVRMPRSNEASLRIEGANENKWSFQNHDAMSQIMNKILQHICDKTKPDCKLQGADTVFLVDGSTSINAKDFELMKSFLKYVANIFPIGPNKFQFGLAQFSTGYQKIIELNDFATKIPLLRKIEEMKQLMGSTYIGMALEKTIALFKKEAGGRKSSGVPQNLLVITDGKSTDTVVASAEKIRHDNINIFAVGTGTASESQLLQISGSSKNMFFVKEFDGLDKIKRRVIRSVCEPNKDCIIDISIGIDVSSQVQFQTTPGSELQLQMHLNGIIDRMLDLHNISCKGGHSLTMRIDFHSPSMDTFDFKSRDSRGELPLQSHITLTADYLLSFLNKFKIYSEKHSKIIVIFTDGIDDRMENLKEVSHKLRLDGVNALIVVPLETKSTDNFTELEFGRGFGYRKKLRINMPDIGNALLSEIDTIAERECCKMCCKCVGQPGPTGPQGTRGSYGNAGQKGTRGYTGEEGAVGNRGRIGVNGTQGADGCQGPRGFQGSRGYRGQKAASGLNGVDGISGEEGNPGTPGLGGEKGAEGNTGSKGAQGFKGDRGDPGLPGDTGVHGADNSFRGRKGDKGQQGIQGEVGLEGYPGQDGKAGNHGRPGRRGVVGSKSRQGQFGVPGPIGPAGYEGVQGSKGTLGSPGIKGERGLTGVQGSIGREGYIGAKGNEGFRGRKGEAGSLRPKGESGRAGPRGPQGMDGTDGIGIPGPKGREGTKGYLGFPGQQGSNGRTGTSGAKGHKGSRGRRGDSGQPGELGGPGEDGYPGTRGFKGPKGPASLKPCELLSYIRSHCQSLECPFSPMDLVFALDMSVDVTPSIYNRMRQIVNDFVQDLKVTEGACPEGARVAVLSYSSTPKMHIRFSDFRRKQTFLKALAKLNYERSFNNRNIGLAMRFVARNVFKHARGGLRVRKVAVFITNGPSQEKTSIVSAALEFRALDITPVVISFSRVPEIQLPFQVDDTKTFQVLSLSRDQQEAKEQLHSIQLCTFCFDMCRPNAQCGHVISPPPISVDMDMAFVVDGSHNMKMMDFARIKGFLSSMLDMLVLSRNPRTRDNRARVALVQYSPPGYFPRAGQKPANLEFGFIKYNSKNLMKRYIEDSFNKLNGPPGVGHAIEWTINNVFMSHAEARRRYKVIFVILAGETSAFDMEKLKAVSRKARCDGFVIFAFSLETIRNNLEDLVSFPIDQHVIRLGQLLDSEMSYAKRFARAFLKSLSLKINEYPHPDLQEECESEMDLYESEIPMEETEIEDKYEEDFENYDLLSEAEREAKGRHDEEDFEEYAREKEAEEQTHTHHDICLLEWDMGDCEDYALKWHFDEGTQGCEQFWYGGCGGNENRFNTLEECEDYCVKSQ